MKNDTVSIVYFSGTGGTELIAREFGARFSAAGRTVRLLSLDKKEQAAKAADFAAVAESGLLLLLYPVYAMGAPAPVHEWLRNMQEGRGLRTAVISVSGGGEMWPNTACRYKAIKLLEAKDCEVFYEDMLIMPPNCMKRASDELAMHLLNAMPRKAGKITEDLLSGRRRRTGFPLFAWPLTLLGISESKSFRKFGQNLQASDKCTACGLCARKCPCDNIVMENGRPSFGGNCSACLRCYYGCPVHAISPQKDTMPIWPEYDLGKVKERMKGKPLPPVENCAKGIMFLTTRRYLKD